MMTENYKKLYDLLKEEEYRTCKPGYGLQFELTDDEIDTIGETYGEVVVELYPYEDRIYAVTNLMMDVDLMEFIEDDENIVDSLYEQIKNRLK